MLFLILDQHLNRPSLEIAEHNGFHRSTPIIGNQGNTILVSATTRENYFDCPQSFDKANPLGNTVTLGGSQAGNGNPSAAVIQDVSAIVAQLMTARISFEPPVGLSDANIMGSVKNLSHIFELALNLVIVFPALNP